MVNIKDKCRRTVIKIAANNVEVQYHLFDERGAEVLITELTETYGISRIDEERRELQNHLTILKQPDYAAQQIADTEVKLTRIDEIETVLQEK